MLRKRPHTLKYTVTVTSDAYQDENGNWVPGGTVTENKVVPCRAEPNGKGATIKSNDGQDIVFAWTVRIDSIPTEVSNGTFVELYDGDRKIGEGIAMRPFDYQKKSVLWV